MHDHRDDRQRAELQMMLPVAGALLLLAIFGGAALMTVTPGADTLPSVVSPRIADRHAAGAAVSAAPKTKSAPAKSRRAATVAAATHARREAPASTLTRAVADAQPAPSAAPARPNAVAERETVRPPVLERSAPVGNGTGTGSVAAQSVSSAAGGTRSPGDRSESHASRATRVSRESRGSRSGRRGELRARDERRVRTDAHSRSRRHAASSSHRGGHRESRRSASRGRSLRGHRAGVSSQRRLRGR